MESYKEIEVKSGALCDCEVPRDKTAFLFKACVKNDISDERDEVIILHIYVDGKKYVAGTLNSQTRRQQLLRITVHKKFQISHTYTNGSVYFSPLMVENDKSFDDDEGGGSMLYNSKFKTRALLSIAVGAITIAGYVMMHARKYKG